MLNKRRRLAALSFAALSLLAACGGGSGPSGDASVEAADDSGPSPAVDLGDLVSSSVTKATGIDTSRFSMTMSIPGADGKPVEVAAKGAVDSAAPFMNMEMDMGSMVPGMSGTMTMLFDGTAMYMKFPAFAGMLGDKEWVKLDLASMSKMSGMDMEALLKQMQQSDPKANLAMMTGASDDVTEVGREEVRGVDTRHLKMTVDMQQSLASAPAEVKEALAKAIEQFGTGTFPAEIWIDDDNLPRRVAYTMDLSKVAGAGGPAVGEVRMIMDFFDYGAEVDTTVPADSETADLFEFLGRMAGSGMGS